ncbi:MAG TPA: hypothetical protein VN429_07030 [Methanospirillum sp.]|nr:hypothetical protein [Methanospirillum sp.]
MTTLIDTVGMAHDSSTITQGYGNPYVNGSSQLFRDSTMTNGGALTLSKIASSGGKRYENGSIDAQKVLSYDAGTTGSHLSASEHMMTTTTRGLSDNSSPLCTLASGDSESSSSTRSFSASASLDVITANTLQLTSRTRISSEDLQYSVSANTSSSIGNYSSPAIVATSFNYGSGTASEMNMASDRSKVSGLFDLFNRVYHGGTSATIQEQTGGSGMVNSRTIAEHTYNSRNITGQTEWTGTAVYASTLLTNGGNFEETRALTADKTTDSQRLVSYHANGSTSMQTEERVVAVKQVRDGVNTSTDPSCAFGGSTATGNGTTVSYQSVSASSQVMGVDSAEIESVGHMDIGSENNGTAPVIVHYRADITSPVEFDASILQKMTDPDNDGKFEDLNGNGKLDMQDLVLLFRNFDWLSKSNISSRFDYNNNGRVDFADLTHAFRDIQKR